MSAGAGINQRVMVGGCTQATPHEGQAVEVGQRQFELAHEYAAWRRDGKTGAIGACGQREGASIHLVW